MKPLNSLAEDRPKLVMAFNALDRAGIRYERKPMGYIALWLPQGAVLPQHRELTEAGAYVVDQYYDCLSNSRVYVYHCD